MLVKNLIRTRGLVFVPVLFFLIQSFLLKPQLLKRTDYVVPSKIIEHMTFGFAIQLADSFWLRAVQDFDFCDAKINQTECKGKSWLFQMLDLITDLDSKFFESYHWGGLSLTIIISDYAGASIIFDKGVAQFPDEWMLSYAAAYHALFEERNKVKAAKLYFSAANHGAPDWVRTMAGRLAAEGGEIEYAKKILSTMIEMSDEPKYISRLQKKLAELDQTPTKN